MGPCAHRNGRDVTFYGRRWLCSWELTAPMNSHQGVEARQELRMVHWICTALSTAWRALSQLEDGQRGARSLGTTQYRFK